MEDGEFDDELNDKELVLEFLEFSTISLQYMTEDLQKDTDFYRRAVKMLVWQSHGVFMMYLMGKN